MTDAPGRPVDAARIREVLTHAYTLLGPCRADIRDHIRSNMDALLRDLDAQGLAPAGWLPARVEQAAWWCCDTSCEPRDKPCANCIDRVNAILEIVSGEQPIQPAAPASPSPALHAPTVEALQTIRDALAYARLTFKDHNEPLDRIEKAQAVLRALTSGAEAGERPLSEWSDDELFRALTKWNWPIGEELRARGWRPHHGGDNAPVEGEVWVCFKDFDIVQGRFAHKNWKNDIIAYRPVPAKAKHAYFDRDDHMGGACRFCGEERKHPNHDWEPPAAAAGEVERACRAFVTARGLNPDTLHQANPGDEWDSFPADSEFTDYTGRKTKLVKGWRKWTEPMKAAIAALRPASSEEHVEQAASENCPWLSPKRREPFIAGALFGARAILASAEAKPGERE